MITTGDIETILYEDLQTFGIPVYKKDAIPEGEVDEERITEERVTIYPKSLKTETYWNKDFVEVNFCVPDVDVLGVLMADKLRLNQLEKEASRLDSVGTFDDTTYRYSVYSIGTEKDPELKCHYVNVKLLFEILNVK